MEALDGALTVLFGSQRSGLDIAIVLITLVVALIALKGSNQIVQAFTDYIAARIRVMEERNQSCVLLAKTLSDIQDKIASIDWRLAESTTEGSEE